MLLIITSFWFGFILPAYQNARLLSPEPSVQVLDRHGRFLATLRPQTGRAPGLDPGHGYWRLDKLPPRVAQATLALEDKRFETHFGVDFRAITRAAWRNFSSHRRLEGASTIAMQIIRMQMPRARGYWNKASEALSAVFLTLAYGREAVLKHYLRIVPYGQQSHGIAYAARMYFAKPVADLSWAEIALLCAIPRAPTLMNPTRVDGAKRAKQRGQRILRNLFSVGLMDRSQFLLAQAQLTSLQMHAMPIRHRASLHAVLQLRTELRRQAYSAPIVRSTLDAELQQQLSELTHQTLLAWQHRSVANAAVIVLEKNSMDVLAWLGSQGYFDPQAGAIDYTQVTRSPGSTLKPFLYAYALENGIITPASILADLPAVARGFRNADNRFLGPMLPRQALANSRNVPAVQLLRRIGLDQAYVFLRNLRLHNQPRQSSFYGLSMSLGALQTNLHRLTRAYGVLANDGLYQQINWFKQHLPEPGIRLLSRATARQITLFLADPLARLPSFPRMGAVEYPFPVAVKTGTSQAFRDAWTIAYSKKYIVGVWLGRHDLRPMQKISGAGNAAVLAQKIMTHLHQGQTGGFADLQFDPPERYLPVSLCVYTGRKAGKYCDRRLTEWFAPEHLPELDRSFKRFAIDTRNGLLATRRTPAAHIKMRRMLMLPMQYYTWAQQNGIPVRPLQNSRLDDIAPTALLNNHAASLRIATPYAGETIIRNPELPDNMHSIALRAEVEPPLPQVLWYVDGKPFKLVAPPYSIRWPLTPGQHTIQLKRPFSNESSKPVKITVL